MPLKLYFNRETFPNISNSKTTSKYSINIFDQKVNNLSVDIYFKYFIQQASMMKQEKKTVFLHKFDDG